MPKSKKPFVILSTEEFETIMEELEELEDIMHYDKAKKKIQAYVYRFLII